MSENDKDQTEQKELSLKFFDPMEKEWRVLKGTDEKVKENKKSLHEMLLTALQMPNLLVLSGSGTSLGHVGGPSMWDLWEHCVNKNLDDEEQKVEATAVIENIGFKNEGQDKENIEALLSHCEAWLQINTDASDEDVKKVKNFVTVSKKTILDKCKEFLKDDKLTAHSEFLRKLSRRSVRNPRLKVFTTNYDLCFEHAASQQGLTVIDGFSFSQPRRFAPSYFDYDIIHRSHVTEENNSYLEGVFHLLKLHGSVNWEHTDGFIEVKDNPDSDKACLIYPARGKYQQSYLQPHFELVSRFFSSLRAPNTCLIVAGFGFNDDHLSEPIVSAIKSNPSFKLIIVNPSAEKLTNDEASGYWKKLFDLAKKDHDILFLNADFYKFVKLIPDLKSLSHAQKIEQAFAVINSVRGNI